METVKRISLALIIIGAINWGLIGLFQFDLVAALFGGQESAISRVVYTLVGIGGVLSIPSLFAPMEDDYNYDANYATEFSEDNGNETFRDKE